MEQDGIELFKSSIFIDDYSEEDNLGTLFYTRPFRHIKNQIKKTGEEMPKPLDLAGKEIESA